MENVHPGWFQVSRRGREEQTRLQVRNSAVRSSEDGGDAATDGKTEDQLQHPGVLQVAGAGDDQQPRGVAVGLQPAGDGDGGADPQWWRGGGGDGEGGKSGLGLAGQWTQTGGLESQAGWREGSVQGALTAALRPGAQGRPLSGGPQ